jgi:type IV secretory pathway TraG/TraD family ATPase VirD4
MISYIISGFILVAALAVIAVFVIGQYKKTLREAKNYERGLKMVPMYIHVPPSSDDMESSGRDERDVTEEVLSQAQVMYNIIASTATKGFKSKIYGQRHLSFEIMAHNGLIHYYTVVPVVLVDVVKQAIAAAYPNARLEEVEEHNIFSPKGKIAGVSGGEFTLKKEFAYPIATYQETKRDASRAMLNAMSGMTRDDGAAVQLLIRPAQSGWTKTVTDLAASIKKKKGEKGGGFSVNDISSILWKPPESGESKPEDKQLTSLEQATVDSIEEKTRHPGYEVLVRVVVSSSDHNRSEAVLKNVIAAFSLFDSSTYNGFKFTPAKDMEELVTSYIFRFFPHSIKQNILNSVELATLFHMPNGKSIPTSQLQRQTSKQVDGPNEQLDEGFLLGYNEFRGVKKEIRLSENDRRRHTYIVGQTGTGKSVMLENLAYQDMLDGKGFAFVDPHGDSAEKLLGMIPKERVEDVIYFDPGNMENPIGLNLFEFDNEDQQDFLIQESIEMLYKLYDPGKTGIVGPRFESWFRNGAKTVMSDPSGSSFLDVQQVFTDQAFTDEKLKHVKNRVVLDFWNKEMAQTSDSAKGEILGWFTSKFGAFLGNDMLRNIIGQSKTGFSFRDIMDNKKILLVNLSKGRMGELNSRLLGMVFIIKFQAAAMSRASMPEEQRQDFSLYVDEFQNFATDSFESILSEARKYRLNLILANQFMTQLTESIQGAIKGNIGTVVSGRIGVDDAEILQKKFAPVFDADDLIKLPNYQTIASVMINGVPSAAFSMSLVPPMGQSNPQLSDALKKLASAKYGLPRAVVEQQIFSRLGSGDAARKAKIEAMKLAQQERLSAMSGQGQPQAPSKDSSGQKPSFLDEWLSKRGQDQPADVKPAPTPPPKTPSKEEEKPIATSPSDSHAKSNSDVEASKDHKLDVRDKKEESSSEEVTIKLR